MTIINLSIPEDLKQAFNETFRGRNKSAIIAELMRDAIEAERHRKEGGKALDAILMLRAITPPGEDDDVDRPNRRRRR